MSIDPNVALSFRGPQVKDPMEAYGQMLSLRDMLQRGQLHQQAIQSSQLENQQRQIAIEEQQRGIEEQRKVQEILSQTGGSLEQAFPVLARSVRPETYLRLQEAHLKTRKTLADINDKELTQRKYVNDQLAALTNQALQLPDEQYASAWPQIAASARMIDPTLQIPDQPIPKDQLAALRLGFMTSENYLKEEAEKRAKEAANQTRQKNAVEEMFRTAQQNEAARHNRAVEQNTAAAQKATDEYRKAQLAVTVRGQNMTDTRARELNAITRENRPPTEGERKALGYYGRAHEAEQAISKLEGMMAEKGLFGQAAYNYAPNWLQSEDNQIYRQAQRQFTEARLRKDSGAAISNAEYEKDAKTYFPQPGDTKATLDRKKQARQMILRTLRAESGRAIRDYDPAAQQPAEAPVLTGVPQVGGSFNGEKVLKVTKVQ